MRGVTREGDGLPDRLARAGVTDREAEVLWAVGERLRNREIAERLHLSVRTVESHIAALLRKLGAPDRAKLAETGLNLRRAARTGAALPAPLSSLIGRESETADLIALLEAHRLVTLVGPAGVGKTLLALRVATVQADRFAGGIRLVDLAPVQPELVGDAIARALGVVPEPGWSLRDTLRELAAEMACLRPRAPPGCDDHADAGRAIAARGWAGPGEPNVSGLACCQGGRSEDRARA